MQPRTDGTAIAALCCAIGAWFAVPLIPAIVAVVLARVAQRRIEESGGWVRGWELALAAKVVGWANIAVFAVAAVIVLSIVIGIATA
jgi:hypothetical protein